MWSHDCWKHRESIIGQEARTGFGYHPWHVIVDVIISPNHNAYALVLDDGSTHDMSTYDHVDIRTPPKEGAA